MGGELTTRQDKAVARLLQSSPSENDVAIVSGLERIFGQHVTLKFTARFASGETVTVVEGVNRPRGTTQEAISRAVEALGLSMAPDSLKSITSALRGLKSLTAHKSESAQFEATTIAVMAKDLQKHPADVTRQVLSRSRHWFPTLHELHAECDALAQPRRAMIHHIAKWTPWDEKDEAAWIKDRKAHLKAVIHDCEKRHLIDGQAERKAEAVEELEQLEWKSENET